MEGWNMFFVPTSETQTTLWKHLSEYFHEVVIRIIDEYNDDDVVLFPSMQSFPFQKATSPQLKTTYKNKIDLENDVWHCVKRHRNKLYYKCIHPPPIKEYTEGAVVQTNIVSGGTCRSGFGWNYSSEVFRYNDEYDEWVNLPELQFGRIGHSMAIHDMFQTEIYVVGGTRLHIEPTRVVEHFNKREWVIDTPLPHAREYCTSIVVDGILYVCGGYYTTNDHNNQFYQPYDDEYVDPKPTYTMERLVNHVWLECTPMFKPRISATAFMKDPNTICIVGGDVNGDDGSHSCDQTFECYDIFTDTWSAPVLMSRLSDETSTCGVPLRRNDTILISPRAVPSA